MTYGQLKMRSDNGASAFSPITPSLRSLRCFQASQDIDPSTLLNSVRSGLGTELSVYIEAVAKAFDKSAEEFHLAPTESARFGTFGTLAEVLDLPAVRSNPDADHSLETRISFAMPSPGVSETSSAKVMLRVGPVDLLNGCYAADVGQWIHASRQAADWLCDWGCEVFNDVYTKREAAINTGAIGSFETATLGSRSESVKLFLEYINGSSEPISRIVQHKYAPYLDSYFKMLKSSLYTPSSDDVHWLSRATVVEKEDGFYEQRMVLYQAKKSDDKVMLYGVGYDDSIAGDLAHRSSLAVMSRMSARI